jgi:hypothetical protein
MSKTQWIIGTSYHMPLGFSKKGTHECYWVSACGRWHVRQGNYGTMILTDRHKNVTHVVKGKMPEVEAKIEQMLREES